MIDAKDFIKDDEVDYSLIDDAIHDSEDSPFDICRLAIKYSELDHSVKIGDYVFVGWYVQDHIVSLERCSPWMGKRFPAVKISPTTVE